jgi:hypothetical protein
MPQAIDNDIKVRVYRNLHTGNFSVQSTVTGLVIGHASSITLRDAMFVVRKAGRERVLRERKKNVHAFVVGFVCSEMRGVSTEVSYNPYSADYFWASDSKAPVHRAGVVKLENNRIFIQKGHSSING